MTCEVAPSLYSAAYWLLGSPEEARDVTQEVLLRLWSRRETVLAPAAWRWSRIALQRLVIDRVRRWSPTANGSANGSLDCIVHGPRGGEDGAGGDEDRATVARALAGLSGRERAILLLRDVHELRYSELATALELPLGTVKAAVHRARARLRSALEAQGVTS